jgi:FMN phosphatase YigB (HAD superfamily)
MIRAIGFDLWETLITDTPALARQQEEIRLSRISAILDACGHGTAAPRLHAAYLDVWEHCYELYWSGDIDIPTRQQVIHLLERLDLDASRLPEDVLTAIDSAYGAAAAEVLPELVPHAAETLRWVREQGLKAGLISNTGRTPGAVLREVLAAHGLAPLIDAMVFSNEHGECKPRRSIFDRLCAALGVAHDEMVFVGDNLYVDVYGAQQCGMRAIHFTPAQRGLAVATRDPLPDLEIRPEATIRTLAELPAVVADLQR